MTAKEKLTGRKADILRIFDGFGRPVTVEETTKACMEAGLWEQDEQDKLLFRAAMAEVRYILNDFRPDGVIASISRTASIERDEGKIVKVNLRVQPAFWSPADAKNFLRTRIKQMRDDWGKLMITLEHFKARWPDESWDSFLPTILWE